MTLSKFRFTTLLFLVTLLFPHISAAETFRVMLHTGSFPPYFFEEGDARTGTIKDIYSAISKETGYDFEYVRVPFKRALYLFEAGKIDIEPMTNPAYRGNSSVPGHYSIPFAVAEEIVLFSKDDYIPFNSPDDLVGKALGVVKGYYYPEFAPYFEDKRIEEIPFKNENKLIQMLLKKRLSQALLNKDFALYAIKEQHLSEKLVVGQRYHVLDMMIRFHPNKKEAIPTFNKAIKNLIKDGTIKHIYNKYH